MNYNLANETFALTQQARQLRNDRKMSEFFLVMDTIQENIDNMDPEELDYFTDIMWTAIRQQMTAAYN